MIAPPSREREGIVYPDGTSQASAPFTCRSYEEDPINTEGAVDFSFHCWHERMPERNVSTVDVEHVLGRGHVIREAEWDSSYEHWKYRVEGTDVEGMN